jgi:hypothetical protein
MIFVPRYRGEPMVNHTLLESHKGYAFVVGTDQRQNCKFQDHKKRRDTEPALPPKTKLSLPKLQLVEPKQLSSAEATQDGEGAIEIFAEDLVANEEVFNPGSVYAITRDFSPRDDSKKIFDDVLSRRGSLPSNFLSCSGTRQKDTPRPNDPATKLPPPSIPIEKPVAQNAKKYGFEDISLEEPRPAPKKRSFWDGCSGPRQKEMPRSEDLLVEETTVATKDLRRSCSTESVCVIL